MLLTILQPPPPTSPLVLLADVAFTWGWLLIVFLMLWIAWETYKLIKKIDYISAIQWTYLQITVPEDAPQTPKSMEQAFEVWGGLHKDPDVIELFLEGYTLAWYSCELHCRPNQVRYIMVVPTVHRKFFEGVIYGQYSTANIEEVEDYTLEFPYDGIEKDFDLYGTEMILAADDIYPIRTYILYEDPLAEDDKYIDPHQALIEAYTNINEGEEFWFQLLVKPISAKEITKWAERGEAAMDELAGTAKKKGAGIGAQLKDFLLAMPGDLLRLFSTGSSAPPETSKDETRVNFLPPAKDAKIKGILQKVSRSGFRVKMRVIHIAPAGKLHKPNVSKAIGVFKQFNTFNLNSLRPDPATKSNGPNLILKQTRRRFRKRSILLNYQWRDFFGDKDGGMMNAEELATLWHLPSKYGRSPSIHRATSGLGSAPDNLPYI